MGNTEYCFIMSAIYLAPSLNMKERFFFGLIFGLIGIVQTIAEIGA